MLKEILEKVKDFGINTNRSFDYPLTSKENILSPAQAQQEIIAEIKGKLPKEEEIPQYKENEEIDLVTTYEIGQAHGFNDCLKQIHSILEGR